MRVKSAFRKGVFASAEDAYKSGQWIRAALYGNSKAKQWCNENGVRVKNAMGTGDNTKGGFLVPDSLQSSIIELREQYGVFARYAGQWNMAGAVDNAPRVNGEITSYYVGEGSEITASDMSFSNVRLEGRKLASLTAVNSELNEDSVISLAQILARSVASKFAFDEDNAGFNGDGTSTFGGIMGAGAAILAGSTITATGITTNANLTMAVFQNAVGRLKEYPGIMPAWFVHKNTWANVMQRLLDALGGNNNSDVASGSPMMFMGYPVVISQVLYSGTGATNQIFGYFGDLGMTSYIGRRRGMQMATDSSVYFTRDQIAIRATQRYDINVYDVGTATDSGGLLELRFG
jgi:HK97 family phage major capsid protein